MIILMRKDNMTMGVCTEVQASVFERNGYKRVEPAKAEKAEDTVVLQEEKPEKPAPQARRRKAK